MGQLSLLAEKAKKHDKEAMKSLLESFKPKIKQSLYQTRGQERNDLEQEIKLKIMESIYRYNFQATPGFWEFIQKKSQTE